MGQGNVTNRSNCYWSAQTNSYELNQITKYGGYYVGRYEAGLPKGTQEATEDVKFDSDIYNFYGIPQSRAGQIPWSFIEWSKAQSNSRKMYENSESVSSGLITGTQWDVMINKIASIDDTKSLTDSKTWGNYEEGEEFKYTGRAALSTSEKLSHFGDVVEQVDKKNKTSNLLTTGASDHNRAYNIYDVAGNLWERTEESSALYNSVSTLETNFMIRAGSCADNSDEYPALYRCDYYPMVDSTTGFRVVLYIK